LLLRGFDGALDDLPRFVDTSPELPFRTVHVLEFRIFLSDKYLRDAFVEGLCSIKLGRNL